MADKTGKMIVISNAEPYKHVTGEEGQPTCREVEGGLTTAMNPQMRRSGGVWIAYGRGERDFEVVDSTGRAKVPDFPGVPEEERYTLKRLDFPPAQYENFYRGYANRILWPIFHSFPTESDLKREHKYWKEGYLPCNKEYARAVIDTYEKGDTIWVHDYHLALVPHLVRSRIPEAKIGIFWHIPWPPWESFGKIPHRKELMKGLAAADLIGLHISEYVENLLTCARRCGLEVDRDSQTFELGGEKTRAEAYPLGVDFDFFDGTDTEGKEERIRDEYSVDNLILGVDRQDYTKGIPERIRAYGKFAQKYPRYRGRVSLIQRTPLSRTGIEEYQLEKSEINEQVSELNGRFGSHDWKPINLFWGGIPQKDLIAEYRAAHVALVTPGLDGMNLVAKEFIAANEEPKVLILSEFAGSSKQLDGALRVNPYDAEAVAEKIKEAIEMSAEEKEARWQKLRNKVRQEDLPNWAKNFLRDLDRAHEVSASSQKLLGLGGKQPCNGGPDWGRAEEEEVA